MLRTLLERSRERLIFYESYDRIIGENIRRTGELMLDSIAVREEAKALAERSDNSRAELEAQAAAIRREHQALVQSLLDELGALKSRLDLMQDRLSAALADTSQPGTVVAAAAAPTPVPVSSGIPAMDATTEAMEAGGAPLAPTSDPLPRAPFQIDVIAQGVSRATTALSLQRFLGELDAVIGVETREFAEGILRLQVTANRSLSRKDLAGWSDGRGFRVNQEQPGILEIELSPNAA